MMMLAILATSVLLAALYRERIKALLELLLHLILAADLVIALRGFLVGLVIHVGSFMRRQMAHGEPESRPVQVEPPADGTRDGYHLNRVLAGLVCLVVFLVCGVFELCFNGMVMEPLLGLGGQDNQVVEVDEDGGVVQESQGLADQISGSKVGWVATLALMMVAVFWGFILLDILRLSRFLPRMGGRARRLLLIVASVMVCLTIVTTVVIGVWRVHQAMAPLKPELSQMSEGSYEESAMLSAIEGEPTELEKMAQLFFGGALPGLVLVTALFSFTGVLWLARYLTLLAVGLMLAVPALLLFLVIPFYENFFSRVLNFKNTLVDALADLGDSVVRNVWPPINDFRDAGHRRARAAAEGWALQPPRPVSPGTEVLDEDWSPKPSGRPLEAERPAAEAASDTQELEVPEPVDEDGFSDKNWGGWAPMGGRR